jgi:hypothetical protein
MNSENQTLVGITKTYLEGGNGKRERENKAAQRIPLPPPPTRLRSVVIHQNLALKSTFSTITPTIIYNKKLQFFLGVL